MDPAVTLATLDRGRDLTAQTDVGTGKGVTGRDAELHMAAHGVALAVGVEIVILPGTKKELIPIPREGLIRDLQALGQSLILLQRMGPVLIPEVGLSLILGVLNYPLLEGNLFHHLWEKARHQQEIILEARVLLSIPVPGVGVIHPVNPTNYHQTKWKKSM